MAPLDQVDHFINTVYTDPRFRPPRPESTPVAPGGPSTPQESLSTYSGDTVRTTGQS